MLTAAHYAQRAEECRFSGDGADLGHASRAVTGEVAVENNRPRRPVSERFISFRNCIKKVRKGT
jgi:hypothetical protein